MTTNKYADNSHLHMSNAKDYAQRLWDLQCSLEMFEADNPTVAASMWGQAVKDYYAAIIMQVEQAAVELEQAQTTTTGVRTMTNTFINPIFKALADDGFKAYEIYTKNTGAVTYGGELCEPDTVGGWDIKHIISKPELLESYPYFDCVITSSSMSICESVWFGADNS